MELDENEDPSTEENQGSKEQKQLNGESSKWAQWKGKHKIGIERAERWFYYFMSALVFLAIAASIGTAIYIGALAIGPIALGLTAALPLGIPAVALSIIGAGILIASVAALLRFVQIHWEMHQVLKHTKETPAIDISDDEVSPSFVSESKPYTYKDTLAAMAETPLSYAFVLFMAAFVIGVSTQDAINMYDANATMAVKLKHLMWTYKYHAAAIVATLALGIALAVPVVPFVMATVMASFGLPYGVAVLFGAVAAATIIAVTYQLLASLTTLSNLYKLAISYRKDGKNAGQAFPYFYVAAAVIGVAIAAGAAYLVFVPLVNVLTPVLASSSLATFLAVAVSVSLAVGMMKLLPAVVVKGPIFVKENFYEGSSLQTWWSKGKSPESIPLTSSEEAKPAASFCSGRAKEYDKETGNQATWRTCWLTPSAKSAVSSSHEDETASWRTCWRTPASVSDK